MLVELCAQRAVVLAQLLQLQPCLREPQHVVHSARHVPVLDDGHLTDHLHLLDHLLHHRLLDDLLDLARDHALLDHRHRHPHVHFLGHLPIHGMHDGLLDEHLDGERHLAARVRVLEAADLRRYAHLLDHLAEQRRCRHLRRHTHLRRLRAERADLLRDELGAHLDHARFRQVQDRDGHLRGRRTDRLGQRRAVPALESLLDCLQELPIVAPRREPFRQMVPAPAGFERAADRVVGVATSISSGVRHRLLMPSVSARSVLAVSDRRRVLVRAHR